VSEPEKRCEPVESKRIMPGWICCECRTYNGEQRTECKWCKHLRCDLEG
jgi:hypothetical protein